MSNRGGKRMDINDVDDGFGQTPAYLRDDDDNKRGYSKQSQNVAALGRRGDPLNMPSEGNVRQSFSIDRNSNL